MRAMPVFAGKSKYTEGKTEEEAEKIQAKKEEKG